MPNFVRITMEASFDSRVYIVTGGAAGIGFSICKLLLEYGAIVYAVDIVPETTAELHSLFKDRFTYLQADIKDVAASQSIVQDIIKKHKRLDGLVNNAAVCLQEGELPEHEMYDSTFDVNVRGAWNFARDTLAQMKEQGSGSIVNVGSLASVDGEARLPLYTASKHALAGFTKTWALDFAKYGVRVNMVAPGMCTWRQLMLARCRADQFDFRSNRYVDGSANAEEGYGTCVWAREDGR